MTQQTLRNPLKIKLKLSLKPLPKKNAKVRQRPKDWTLKRERLPPPTPTTA